MRRILIFSLFYYHRRVAGAEVAVKEITDRISEEEFEFHMIALNGGGEKSVEKVGTVTVHRIFKGPGIIQKLLYPFVAYSKAVELHKVHHFDTLWAIMASYAGFAALLFKRKFPHVPSLLTIQEGEHFELRAGVLKPVFCKIFQSADYLQVISKFLAEWAEKMGARGPIVVVPNAVDIELFAPQHGKVEMSKNKALQDLKIKLGKKPGDTFLITTSRLSEKNAIGDIISALSYLSPTISLLILGQGQLETTLKMQVATLLLEHRVRFLGYVAHADMPHYLHVSDIFIRPSLTEGLGNSFLEAMAAEIPVIATPVGGIPDFLIDGETGLFCEVKNPRSIAQKVEKLIKDPESYSYIVKRAGAMVREKYQWSHISDDMAKIFRMLS